MGWHRKLSGRRQALTIAAARSGCPTTSRIAPGTVAERRLRTTRAAGSVPGKAISPTLAASAVLGRRRTSAIGANRRAR